ncbi:MAG: amidophosphoribosyltransferase, partial [Pseudomonadota bacterium]
MIAINPDKPREECAVFAIAGHEDAAQFTALGLHALQHRGQEATGMAVYDGREILVRRDEGLVGDVFSAQGNIAVHKIGGFTAIGHNRYSTQGKSGQNNAQPIYADLEFGGLSMAHNGQFTNARSLRKKLVKEGSIFQSTTDTETLMHLIAHSSGDVLSRLRNALATIKGAYALVILTQEGIYGARDPVGIRPLILGKLDAAHILCSETVGLDIIGAEFVREIAPGEIVHIANDGTLTTIKPLRSIQPRPCLFEFVYFSRPDSFLHGKSIYDVRKNTGRELAREYPLQADVVVSIPDSGNPAALGYA